MANIIQIKRGTGSSEPSQGSLAEGELAINLDSGKLFYGSGSSVLSDFTVAELTASGIISSSGNIYGDKLYSNNQAVGYFDGTNINFGYENSIPIRIGKSANPTTFMGNITASGVLGGGHISASGDLEVRDITASNIAASNIESTSRTFTYSTTNLAYSGDVVSFGSGPGGVDGDINVGELYYLDSAQQWEKADADTASSATNMLGIAVADDTPTFLVKGIIANSVYTGFTTGAPLYVHTTEGDMTGTAPSSNGNIVRVVGYCINGGSRVIYFNPDNTWVEIA